MKKIAILRILDLFAFLFKHSDMNYQTIRLILQLKFNLDRRRTPLGFRNLDLKPNKDHNLFLYSVLFYGFMGMMFVFLIIVLSLKSFLLGSVTFYTILMVFIAYAVIIEFSLDIFDISDRNIILPKPVTSKEINIAKNLHIIFYMLAIAFAFSLPTLVVWTIFFGFSVALASLVSIIFCIFFLFFLSALLYGFLLNQFSGEKLKDIINLVQIISIITIFVGYQLFIQSSSKWMLIELTQISNLIFLFPPTWFAMPSYMIATKSISLLPFLTALAGLGIAFFGYQLYLTKLAPSFEKNLYKLSLHDTKSIHTKKPFALVFKNLFQSPISQAFYQFSVLMLCRERKIKQAIYPILAFGFVIPIFLFFRLSRELDSPISQTSYFFFMYYNVLMVMPMSVYINFSEYHQATWIYRFLPVRTPSPIIKSAHIAIFFKYQILILLGTSLLYLVIWKFSIFEHVAIMLLNSLILQLIYYDMAGLKLPFSEEIKTGQNTAFKQGSYLLTMMVYLPLSVLVHFLSTLFPLGVTLLIILQLIALWLLYQDTYKITWADLQSRQIKKKKKKK